MEDGPFVFVGVGRGSPGTKLSWDQMNRQTDVQSQWRRRGPAENRAKYSNATTDELVQRRGTQWA